MYTSIVFVLTQEFCNHSCDVGPNITILFIFVCHIATTMLMIVVVVVDISS